MLSIAERMGVGPASIFGRMKRGRRINPAPFANVDTAQPIRGRG